MSKLFDERMTSSEARKILFSSVDGKTKEEIAQIKEEYSQIAPKIAKRELEKGKGWFTSDLL